MSILLTDASTTNWYPGQYENQVSVLLNDTYATTINWHICQYENQVLVLLTDTYARMKTKYQYCWYFISVWKPSVNTTNWHTSVWKQNVSTSDGCYIGMSMP